MFTDYRLIFLVFSVSAITTVSKNADHQKMKEAIFLYEDELNILMFYAQDAVNQINQKFIDLDEKWECEANKVGAYEVIEMMKSRIETLRGEMENKFPSIAALGDGYTQSIRPCESVNKPNSKEKGLAGNALPPKNTTLLLKEVISSHDAMLDEMLITTKDVVEGVYPDGWWARCRMKKEPAFKKLSELDERLRNLIDETEKTLLSNSV